MTKDRKTYSNGEVTVIWQPEKCIHSERCFKGLPEVFDPNARPWINIEGADSESIASQVRKCPSGALSLESDENPTGGNSLVIEAAKDGPLLVYGEVTVRRADGTNDIHQKSTALCRCGASEKKPYCDGSHKRIKFQG